jgi:hypothetical protein
VSARGREIVDRYALDAGCAVAAVVVLVALASGALGLAVDALAGALGWVR